MNRRELMMAAAAAGAVDCGPGARHLRADNAMSPGSLQSFVTWGGRQSLSTTIVAPTIFAFPTLPGPIATTPIPNLMAFDQLVDMRYPRPTSWAVSLYIENPFPQQLSFAAPPNPSDQATLVWNVTTSVGHATNSLKIEQRLVGVPADLANFGPIIANLINLQVAAHTIQIKPEYLEIDANVNAGVPHPIQLNWSAWIAPLVD
jgi:hypothetical protein